MWELFPTLQTQEQLSLSANKAHKFVCTVMRTVEFNMHEQFHLPWVLIHLNSEIEKEISQQIAQKNKSFVLTQTQYKITDQIHGKVC